jgi:PAS domain S-box-containing protein
MIDALRTKAISSYFHNSGQFYYILTDLSGNCFHINPLFLQQNGFAGEDIQGTSFSSFIPSGEWDRYKAILKECIAKPGTSLAADLHHHLPDGSYILARWEFQALIGEYKETDCIQCIGTRIREIQAVKNTGTDEKAISNKERYKAYELSAQGLWRLELEIPASVEWTTAHIIDHCRKYGYMAECNDQMAKMYGLQKDSDVVGMRIDSLMNFDQPKQVEFFTKFIQSGYTITEAETEEYDINGRKIYFLNNMTGIIEDGMLKRIWGTQQDITEKKKTEEQLLRSELFYRNLIGDSLDGILLTDTNGLITFASPSVEKILGYQPEDIIQTTAFAYAHPDDQAIAISTFQDEVRMEPLIKFIDIRLRAKNGEWIPCNVRGHNMLYNPYIGRMVIYFTDDSRRKEMEDRLKESQQELISQEIQKQKLLTQATIDGQEKERKEIGKELHDNISQHLTTTRLYLEVAQERAVRDDVKDLIYHAHKELTDIINEIRKLSQSLVPPTLGDIGLVESIQDVCTSLKRAHTIEVDFHHRSFTEDSIPDNMKLMLFRIIQEQINNIIRHAAATTLHIRLQSDAESLELNITDNGQGFDPDANGKKGLGLTNIINRVGLFNGKVDLQSAPGKGCTILVTVPLK